MSGGGVAQEYIHQRVVSLLCKLPWFQYYLHDLEISVVFIMPPQSEFFHFVANAQKGAVERKFMQTWVSWTVSLLSLSRCQ